MAYNESLAARIRNLIDGQPDFSEKKMFGGLSFLYRGKMSVGILGDELIVRVLPEKMEEQLARPGVGEMAFTGKPMKEFVTVTADLYQTEPELRKWLRLGIEHAAWKSEK